MTLSHWLIYAFVALACIISPGPAVLLAISNGVKYGSRAVLWSSLGNITGVSIVSSLAMVGVGALLKTSASAFLALKLVGAVYLLYLGIRQWRSKKGMFAQHDQTSTPTKYRRLMLYRQAVLVSSTNPKSILFFTALFPQFLSPAEAVAPQFAILTATFMALSYLLLVTYGVLGSRLKEWFGTRTSATWPNKLFGGVFMAFGFGLLTVGASTK